MVQAPGRRVNGNPQCPTHLKQWHGFQTMPRQSAKERAGRAVQPAVGQGLIPAEYLLAGDRPYQAVTGKDANPGMARCRQAALRSPAEVWAPAGRNYDIFLNFLENP